jgi:hypothetical protein
MSLTTTTILRQDVYFWLGYFGHIAFKSVSFTLKKLGRFDFNVTKWLMHANPTNQCLMEEGKEKRKQAL